MSMEQVLSFMLILARVSAFVAVFPLFARRQIPAMVKIGLATSLSIFWFATLNTPMVPAGTTGSEVNTFVATGWIVREVGIGILLGMTLGFLLIPVKIAGAYVGQEFGLTLAATADPSSPDSSGEVTQLFETLAILAFFALNLHHFVILLIHASFEQLAGKIDLLRLPTEPILVLIGNLDEYGLAMIAPVAICLFVLNLAMVLLNKVAPNLNLFTIGMTLRSSIGLLCVFVFLPVIMHAAGKYFNRVQQDLVGIYGLFLSY